MHPNLWPESLEIFSVDYQSAGNYEVGYITIVTNSGSLKLAPLMPQTVTERAVRAIVDKLNQIIESESGSDAQQPA